ncbi:MAG: type II toxin-antitoxin system PemK/MazF family toxin [Vicinamibacteria bacterium]|nr:type II toxin-antitoxin system PemK/MazF family toxin [Vicinamibacteria bacterium]
MVATRGACTGKPRPAVVIQSDLFNPTHASVTICPITSDCVDAPLFRLSLPPGSRTGLKHASQVMVDKVVSVPRAAVGDQIGACSPDEMDAVAAGLRRWLGLD